MVTHTNIYTKQAKQVIKSVIREDPLKRRLRRMAREIISHACLKDNTFSCLRNIYNKEVPLCLRVLWLFLALICIAATFYQIYDRTTHYRSSPVAVDVFMTEETHFNIGDITFCAQDTEPLRNAAAQPKRLSPENYECFNYALCYIDKSFANNTDTLWSLMNTSHILKSINITSVNGLQLGFKTAARNLPMSSCITITNDEKITMGTKVVTSFYKPVDACETSALWILIHPPDSHPETRKCVGILFGAKINLALKIVQYVFENRQGNRCGTVHSYSQCLKNCHQILYKSSIPCRFPFMNRDLNMPACKLSTATRQHYIKACQVAYSTDPYRDCNCTRPCIRTEYDMMFETVAMEQNETTFLVYVRDRRVTTFRERLDYDLTALVCDVGGNMGLCLGLSVASFIDILYSLFMTRKNSKSSFSTYDPLYQKVNRIYNKSKKKESNMTTIQQPCVQKRNSFAFKRLKLTVYCLTTLASVYLVYQRIDYYFHEPLKIVVDVNEDTTIQFPTIAICGVSIKIFIYKKNVVKKGIIADKCDVELLDILDLNKYGVEELWRKTSIMEFFDSNIEQVIEGAIGKMYLENITQSEVPTPHGLCIQYKSGPQPYIGTMTAFSAFSPIPNKDKECHRYYRTVYFTNTDSDHDVISVNELATEALVYIYIQSYKLQRLNSTKSPCVSSKTFYDCKRRCFNEKLQSLVSCRLPYMTSLGDLGRCNSSVEAKVSNFAYLNLSASFDARKDCNCNRQCEEVIYAMRTHEEPMSLPVTAFVFSFFSNIIPTMREAYVYSTEKLISDVGSITGVMVGFSLLEAFNLLISKLQICLNVNRK